MTGWVNLICRRRAIILIFSPSLFGTFIGCFGFILIGYEGLLGSGLQSLIHFYGVMVLYVLMILYALVVVLALMIVHVILVILALMIPNE
jgi:hypothetical protein